MKLKNIKNPYMTLNNTSTYLGISLVPRGSLDGRFCCCHLIMRKLRLTSLRRSKTRDCTIKTRDCQS